MLSIYQQLYPLGLFSVDDLKQAVQVGYMTSADFKTITGQDYVAA